MKGIEFDEKYAGNTVLIVIRYGEATTQEHIEHFEVLEKKIKEYKQFGVVSVPMTSLARPNSVKRRLGCEHIEKNWNLYNQKCLGWGFVSRSLMDRGVLTAMSWISDFPCEVKVYPNEERALQWLISLCPNVPHKLNTL